MAKDRGLTLIELLVALLIAAIIAGMAAPTLADLVAGTRLTTATNRFVSTLHYARSEAIKRGERVTLCKSPDNTLCTTTGDWHQGWVVFVDADDDGQRGAGETLLAAVSDGVSDLSISGNYHVQNYISYLPSGATRTTGGALQLGTITLCHDDQERRIIISRAGRLRVERGTC